MVPTQKIQRPDEIVRVDQWTDKVMAEVYPEGARDKKLIFCPIDVNLNFLIPEHKYLFKESMRRHPVQLFSEIVAYRLGCLIGVEVPPAFLAISEGNGAPVCGALIEWFYDYPGSTGDIYVRGGDLAEKTIENFDQQKGRKHNIEFVLNFCNVLSKMKDRTDEAFRREAIHDPWEHWVKVFTFDALIGNTDRHQDNWGVVLPPKRVAFSPAFDNGTSLGYEIFEENFHKFSANGAFERYVNRGRHHVRWDALHDDRIQHFDLIAYLLDKYPDYEDTIASMLNFNEDALYNSLSDLCQFDVPTRFTEERLNFIIKLLLTRTSKIKDILARI